MTSYSGTDPSEPLPPTSRISAFNWPTLDLSIGRSGGRGHRGERRGHSHDRRLPWVQQSSPPRFVAGIVLYDGEATAGSGDGLYAVPVRRLVEAKQSSPGLRIRAPGPERPSGDTQNWEGSETGQSQSGDGEAGDMRCLKSRATSGNSTLTDTLSINTADPTRIAVRPSLVLSLIVLLGCHSSPTWRQLDADIRARWPTVAQLSTDHFAAMLAAGDHVLIIDVGQPVEFAVSHVPGAINLPEGSPRLAETIHEHAQADAIVLYCSVGWRSTRVAAGLGPQVADAPVFSLAGSIFAWANEGRPLAGPDGRSARMVHPYDGEWGSLLDPKLRSPLDR